jgi:type I restriction enzyme, S subunit
MIISNTCNLPDEWEIKKLSDVCCNTSNIKWKDNRNVEFKYVDLTAVSRDSLQITEAKLINSTNAPSRAMKIIKTNDVIFATTRPTLKRIAIILNNYNNQICSTGFVVLRNKKSVIEPEFIFYYLQSDLFIDRMESLQRGTSYPAVTDRDVKETILPIPPINEQKRIVAKLDKCFEAIHIARANVEKNLQNAKDLFQSQLNQVFSQKGDGWVEMLLGEVCSLVNGRAYKKIELLDSGKYQVLRVGNFFTNRHWYYSNLELNDKLYCDNGDLLYAWSASFGPKIWDGRKVIYHYHIWKVVPNTQIVSKEFLFRILEWDTENIKSTYGTGATMIHVSKGSMESRKIPIPTLAIQEKLNIMIDELKMQTKTLELNYQQELDALDELKKSILQKAFNGEL